jgi:hypothetical protein
MRRLSFGRNFMPDNRLQSLAQTALLGVAALAALVGCGTTRSSDSLRTATEQLLISDAIDRAVQTIDFQPLARQSVYVDDTHIKDVVDHDYLVSTLRQHLLACGCTLKNNRDQAEFIVEVRAGAVGTDRNDLLFGIPATNVPQLVPLQGVPTAIPEVPLAKRSDQRGVAKLAMFAYHRETGKPVWQSGIAARESSSNDVWLFGAGPFQYGSIMKEREDSPGTGIATTERNAESHKLGHKVRVSQRALFASPTKLAKEHRRLPAPTEVAADGEAAKEGDVQQVAATIPEAASPAPVAEPKPPAPFSPSELAAKVLMQGLGESMSPKKRVVPRLTGDITHADLVPSPTPKTADLADPTRDTNSIPLPQPLFDSM